VESGAIRIKGLKKKSLKAIKAKAKFNLPEIYLFLW